MCKSDDFNRLEILQCKVLENENIGDSMFYMKIGGREVKNLLNSGRSGQFINIYLKDKSTLLPRPISLCEIEKELVAIVYKVVGKGTKEMSGYTRGDTIRISENLGNGYNINEKYRNKRVIIIGGGSGIPPLVQLAKELKLNGANTLFIAGFRDKPFLVDQLNRYCEESLIITESGIQGQKGTIRDILEKKQIIADEFFACGPKPMLKYINEYCMERNIKLNVSLEERMGCGFGACVGCAVEVFEDNRIVNKKACKDGPVFDGRRINWNE